MPNGFTDPDAVHAGQTNSATKITCLFAVQGWGGDPIWYVGRPTNVDVSTKGDVDGMVGWGLNGGSGVTGWGGAGSGTGVRGLGGINWPVYGPQGGKMTQLLGGDGVVGGAGPGSAGYTISTPDGSQTSPQIMSGWGVLGFGGDVTNLPSKATSVVPVHPGVGVYGGAGYGEGINPGSGVVGDADSDNLGLSPFNIFTNCGVAGCGPTGVYGFSALGYGVLGASLERGMAGVLGVGPKGGRGVTGHVTASKTADDAHTYAIHGLVTPYSPHPQGGPYAGWFDGPVMVNGDFTIAGGGKSVAVPFTDGSHRRLYCMESPECWFEDFGEGRLKSGRAVVKINADFAKVTKPGDHHIFFTPKGDCRGLYVHRQGGASFEVRELQGGKSNVAFSYRIVGRRKDFKAERFAKVAIPKAPKPPKLPAAPKVKERSPTKPSVGRPPSGALSAD